MGQKVKSTPSTDKAESADFIKNAINKLMKKKKANRLRQLNSMKMLKYRSRNTSVKANKI